MSQGKCWLAMPILLFVLLAFPRAGAAVDFADGLAAYRAGDYEQAYAIFSELLREHPADEEVNFALGLSAFGAGKFSHALFAFDRVLMMNPQNQRARLELARTYYAIGQYDLARELFQEVYDANPPENVKRNVRAFLDSIRHQTRRWRVSGQISLSGLYDDNVNYGPSSKTVDTLLGELQVVSNALPSDTWGGAVSASLTFAYDWGRRHRWESFGGLAGYRNVLDEAEEHEIAFGRAFLGLRRLGRQTLLELPLRGDALDYGGEPLLRIAGSDPSLVWAPTRAWRLTSRLNTEYRDYRDNDDRDATFLRLGQAVGFFWGRERHSLSVYANAFREDADGRAFENDGWEIGLGGEAKLAAGVSLYAGTLYRETDYGDVLYPDLQADPRDDEQAQFFGGIRKAIGRVSIDLNHRFINNRSNFGLYDYERNISTLTTVLEF